jgi:hypothetical protein
MMARLLLLLCIVMLPAAALAEPPGECLVAQHQVEQAFPLPQVKRAIAAKKLVVLVVGSASSSLPGRGGAVSAYPARLQKALSELLPGVAVTVATDVKPHRTAAVMVQTLKAVLTANKPNLVIWQTGTVDAIQAVDPDQFSDTLAQGIDLIRAAGADPVLVNAQYSPRTESMIALTTYADDMRWVALQHEVPLFNRFDVMKLWADLGTFDFTDAPNKLAMAKQVHDCIGWLLAGLVAETVKPAVPPLEGGR